MTETLLNEELGLPEFLVRRSLPDEYVGRRYLDDEEVTMLAFLDSYGRISSTCSLMEFMLLMTRIDKLDHRILCMEILQNLLEPSQQKEFIAFGGYRLLKRWIKNAEDEDFVDELRLLVKLCLNLPFDSNAAKHSEIGKSIKKLQKHQSKSGHDVAGLYSDVQHLMDHWKEMVHQAAVLRQEQQQIEEERKEQLKQQAPSQQKQVEKHIASINHISKDADFGINESKASEAMDVDEEPIRSSPTQMSSVSKHLMEVESLTNEVFPSAPSFQFKSGPSLRERKPLDMLEGARKLLAMRQQETTEVSTDISATVVNTEKNILQQPIKPMSKGGLKKKDSNGKREKLGVKWADEEGGLLREVQTIEVEKIKSSVATYKTHKDLVKKEKQLEKEVHLLKTESAMHKTTDWKSPKALNLSLEILDNIGTATGSIEKDRQDKRLAHVLEVRYLDESLIPNDPDEDPNMNDIPLPDTLSTATLLPNDGVIQSIPWHIVGSMEEEEEVIPSVSSQSYSSGLYGSNTSLLNNSISSSLHTPAYDEYSFNTLLNSLPTAIQMLDPLTLQMIAQNPQILSTLLTPDGQQVDEANLMTLQNSTSVEEYYSSLLPSSSATSSYPYDYSSMGSSQNWRHHGGLTGGMSNSVVDSYQSWQSASNPMEDAGLQLFMNTTTSSYGTNSLQIPLNRDLLASLGVGNSTMAARTTAAKFPTTKASTPCRFFNTPKGCINGDKCPFGHFLDTATSSIAISRSGPGHRPVGPGSRPIRAGDIPSATALAGNLLAARGMKRSRK